MDFARISTLRVSKAEKRHMMKKCRTTGHSLNTLMRELIQKDMEADKNDSTKRV